MDIEDISCYSFRVRNMIAMQMAIPAAAPPAPCAGLWCVLFAASACFMRMGCVTVRLVSAAPVL